MINVEMLVDRSQKTRKKEIINYQGLKEIQKAINGVID